VRAVDLIEKKRDGGSLTAEEIRSLVAGFSRGDVPDYQMSAFLMAVVLRGMDERETADLTMAMVDSGERLSFEGLGLGAVVDKHSTGGVGDKTTLVVAPLVAACGLPVGKMSGRGLGFSGGTLDKLESIPGFRVQLSKEEFVSQLQRIGIVIAGQSAELAPADGAIYALRDVTGTVPSIPLIASSIMSKKIAGGANAVVLDVKVGSGAFMKDRASAAKLARLMVRIGTRAKVRVVAELTDMEQPLGFAVGNALEVKEAIETLSGGGPPDLRELALAAGAEMLVLGGKARSTEKARTALEVALADGSGLRKFRQLVEAQGGDPRAVDHPALLPRAKEVRAIRATRDGWISAIHADAVGVASVRLGAGREKKGDSIDHSAGIVLRAKVGERVPEDGVLAQVHSAGRASDHEAVHVVERAIKLSRARSRRHRLIFRRIAASAD
jgi:pyrimidine-nucleoside phosphorylase